MRAQYSTGFLALFIAPFASAGCPPGLVATATAVAELRSVPAPFSPPCRLIPLSAVRGELDRKLRRDLELPPEVYLEALVRLGMIGTEGRTAYPKLLDFYASEVLGFYEPGVDEMVLVDSPLAGGQQAQLIWAHELAHAAQEHRFSLPTLLLSLGGDSDAQRAVSAVAEGEAMLVTFLLAGGAGASQEVLATAEKLVQQQASLLVPPAGVPEYFVADLLFPYANGFTAVLQSYRKGGWEAVDAMLADPPRSTAALIHPDRQEPVDKPASCPLPPLPAGWDEVTTDTMGEWGLAFWLSRRLPPGDASELAVSWNGDRLRLIRNTEEEDRWGLALCLCLRPAGRSRLAAALEEHLPALLGNFRRDGLPPTLALTTTEEGLRLRADWPEEGPATQTPPQP